MFRDSVDERLSKAIAISMCSSFSQLSAEVVGRVLGGGGLKLDLSDVRSIMVFPSEHASIVNVESAYAGIDAALRRGNRPMATQLADEFVVSWNAQALDRHSIGVIAETLKMRRKRRGLA
jgi:hypothetical protein